MTGVILLALLSFIIIASGLSGYFQNVSALTPVADLSGEWSGTGQFTSNLYGLSCADTVAISVGIKQDDDNVSGTYSFVGTSARDLNPDPESGNRCALWEASGGTFYGTLSGSRISVTLSDDGLTYSGTYTSRLIKLSVATDELSGTIQLTATSLSSPAFEPKEKTPQPPPEEKTPQPPPEDQGTPNQGNEPTPQNNEPQQESQFPQEEEKQLDDILDQMENEPEQNNWAEVINPEITKETPEIIIPARIPDNFFRSNGCGSQGKGGIDVPDFDFAESCNQHDVCYGRGGNAEDRKLCDEEFYESIKSNSVLGKFGATIYYWGVRLGGVSSFNCVSTSCR